MSAEFLKAIKDTLALEEPVSMDDHFRGYKKWDSLAYLAMNLMLEELYGIEIARDKFKEMETLNDIYKYATGNSDKT